MYANKNTEKKSRGSRPNVPGMSRRPPSGIGVIHRERPTAIQVTRGDQDSILQPGLGAPWKTRPVVRHGQTPDTESFWVIWVLGLLGWRRPEKNLVSPKVAGRSKIDRTL